MAMGNAKDEFDDGLLIDEAEDELDDPALRRATVCG